MSFYDGTKLLSLSDINGNKPEIYICTTNRSGGKTTYFNRWAVNKYLKENEKFILLYRWKYEIMDIAAKFFSDIQKLFFTNYEMEEKFNKDAGFTYLYLKKNGENKRVNCGYGISLNSADQLKKYSHLLSDGKRILFDEFQSETNTYASNEVVKFHSIHTSIARGNGEQVRYVPVIMISNPVTILNPYYTALGITSRLTPETKFMRGEGWVLEQGYNESASKAQESSAFNKAFKNSEYLNYSINGNYLLDNSAFIERMEGKYIYLATLKADNEYYALKEFTNEGIFYCDTSVDLTYPVKIAINTESHAVNTVMINRYSILIENMRKVFESGLFRFKNIACKDVVLKMIQRY